MTNNLSAQAAGTMETIQWYEKAGLHCRTNHRQGSSFSLLRAPLLFSTPSAIHGTLTIHPFSPFVSLLPYLTLCYPIPHSRARFVSARVDIPDLTFPFILLSSLFEQRGKNRTPLNGRWFRSGGCSVRHFFRSLCVGNTKGFILSSLIGN